MYFKDLAMDINRNNYETSFLLYLDRELNPSEMLEVEKFLSENTDLQKEFELLQHTVFLPEEIVYDHKELLFHKEEKRRVIPLFWIRIAASVLLLMTAGWFILTKISNDHKREIADSNKSQITRVPAGIRKDSVNPDLNIKSHEDRKGANEIHIKDDEIIPGGVKGIAKKSGQSYQNGEKSKIEKNIPGKTIHQDIAVNQSRIESSKDAPVQDEPVVTIPKSNAATDVQPEGMTGNNPKQISAMSGAQVPTLVLATTASKNLPASEKSDSKESGFSK